MKHLILLLVLTSSSILYSQDLTFVQRHLPHKDGKVFYQKVVEVNGATAKDLFISAKIWAYDAFEVTKNDLQVEELERGVLIFIGSIKDVRIKNVSNPTQSFKLKLEFKDGKYRYTMFDFILSYESEELLVNKELETFISESIGDGTLSSKRLKGFSDYLLKLNQSFLLLMDDLEKELKGGNQADDW